MTQNFNEDNQTPEEDTAKEENKTAIYIFIFFVIIAFFWTIIAFLTRKKQKSTFYKTYNVTDKTFKKWIIYFCDDAITPEKWRKKRLFTKTEFEAIENCLGKPEPQQFYSKKDLTKIAGFKKYEYLKWEIEDGVDNSKMKFSLQETYDALNKFPPKMKDLITTMVNENKV